MSKSHTSVHRTTESGAPITPVYTASDLGEDLSERLGLPGTPPYTRGVHQEMYLQKLWTMRQYAGFATASESNHRYHELLQAGTTGLSVAFDLPTQMGYDSDNQRAEGEVGRVGVAIDSVEDMHTLFKEIDLSEISCSMTINAPAAVLLLMYQIVAEENGVSPLALRGTVQNDILKEYIARGTYVFPPSPSLRLITDTFAYCHSEMPAWNTISISGYHMGEAGATPAQEMGFTLSNAIEYVRHALSAGLEVDEFAPRLTFFFVARTTVLEEIAKFRAARRIWTQVMRDEFSAQKAKSQMLRFHTQTAGVQLTAEQPEVNTVRVALQALAAVCGGTQSLHTNAYDEALALPSSDAARLSLRTQQVLAYETDIPSTVDPFAGSYAIEAMTDEIEVQIREVMEGVAARGGALQAVEEGFQKAMIEESAYRTMLQIESGERTVVGVNAFTEGGAQSDYVPLRVDPRSVTEQIERVQQLRARRDQRAVDEALRELRDAASGTENVLPPMKRALQLRATLGEVCDTLRDVWGTA